ncbi:MAG: 3-phosphoshikimate 1-carboxyvinyltransferase, partial [Xanthomonadales bacterium]|nr:3-phosphoshikimate 1-carboxyvinyltransferase [Xanthomonadales bacterium]
CAPLEIEGGKSLRGIRYRSPVASAQVKSCVLLAGLHASGTTEVIEPGRSRDHTERMLPVFGVEMPAGACVTGGSRLAAAGFEVPADPSSAAFMMAAACLVPESHILLRDVGLNPTRTGFIEALEAMNADVRLTNRRRFGGEPVGDIEVRWRTGLGSVALGARSIPAIIDELPLLMAMAGLADGVTQIRGAEELRVKESDRIAVMAAGMEALGFGVRAYPDGIDIEGQPSGNSKPGANGRRVTVDAMGDHRCAMSFCVLAQALDRPVRILGCAEIATSYPGFVDDLRLLGGQVQYQGESVNA